MTERKTAIWVAVAAVGLLAMFSPKPDAAQRVEPPSQARPAQAATSPIASPVKAETDYDRATGSVAALILYMQHCNGRLPNATLKIVKDVAEDLGKVKMNSV